MSRPSLFGSPLFLGFDHLEQMLDRVGKNADGYPPYNIEQIGENRLRITLAVAGFSMDDLQITQEDNQLVIRGRQKEEDGKAYLHRGIAARQFQRHGDVFQRRHGGDQVEGLEDDADVAAAKACEGVLVERGQVLAGDRDRAAVPVALLGARHAARRRAP